MFHKNKFQSTISHRDLDSDEKKATFLMSSMLEKGLPINLLDQI